MLRKKRAIINVHVNLPPAPKSKNYVNNLGLRT
jgi:hypothetical protein